MGSDDADVVVGQEKREVITRQEGERELNEGQFAPETAIKESPSADGLATVLERTALTTKAPSTTIDPTTSSPFHPNASDKTTVLQTPPVAPTSPPTSPDHPLPTLTPENLNPELLEALQTSALFPSPSSSFRPPPELESESDLASRLDERVAAAKREAGASEGAEPPPKRRDEGGTGEKETFAVPALPTPRKEGDPSSSSSRNSRPPSHPSSRPPSRPPSVVALRRRRTHSNTSKGSDRLSTHSAQPSPRLPEATESSSSVNDLWSAPALLSSATAPPSEILLIVRDYAFERTDPRFHGEPHPDDLRSSRGSDMRASRYSSSDSPALGNDAFASSGSSAFSWGFVTSHQTDFPGEEDESQVYSEEEVVAGEFVAGIYSAVYDFERELESEMTIKSGEFVTVFTRECAGWVQAGRMDGMEQTGEVGLVPENYLTLVQRLEASPEEEDGEDEDEDDKSERLHHEDWGSDEAIAKRAAAEQDGIVDVPMRDVGSKEEEDEDVATPRASGGVEEEEEEP